MSMLAVYIVGCFRCFVNNLSVCLPAIPNVICSTCAIITWKMVSLEGQAIFGNVESNLTRCVRQGSVGSAHAFGQLGYTYLVDREEGLEKETHLDPLLTNIKVTPSNLQYSLGRHDVTLERTFGADDEGADSGSGKVGSGTRTSKLVMVGASLQRVQDQRVGNKRDEEVIQVRKENDETWCDYRTRTARMARTVCNRMKFF